MTGAEISDAYMRDNYPAEWVCHDHDVQRMIDVIEMLATDTFVRVADHAELETTIMHHEEGGHYLVVAPLSEIHSLYELALAAVDNVVKH